MKKYLLVSSIALIYACGGGGGSSSTTENKNIPITTFKNPEPNIPTECYTDTGIVRKGNAIANPCYVCHTKANTPYINEVEDYNLTMKYDFPEEIKKMGNPWLNAIKPDLTLKNIPIPSDEEIDNWIKKDNWGKAYYQRGRGDLVYFPDIPPIYKYENGQYKLVNIDDEGFIKDPVTGKDTGWRAFKWKPFPGFFPTNGRIDSTMIKLPLEFQTLNGIYNKDIYKKNLAIVECVIRGVAVGKECKGTEVGDITIPLYYEGDAKNIPVITYQYPPGTELAHPVYYLDPDNKISFKAIHLKEMRYMKKIKYADVRPTGGEEEEEEGGTFYWDKGQFFNLSGNWLMRAYIEDKSGDLRPQTAEESKFCMSCHGGVGGTVDGTFALWRKVPGKEGWRDSDYNLSQKTIKDWMYSSLDDSSLGDKLKAIESYVKGEYQLYFALTDGGDHFRSNEEIKARISKDTEKISIYRDENIITNPNLINYLDENGYIKPDLWLPSKERAFGIDKQYYRVVQAQAFIWGRDVFDKPFGISSGGNSLEKLDNLESTGVKESGLWAVFKTFLDFVKNLF